jgi:hypothetical protein
MHTHADIDESTHRHTHTHTCKHSHTIAYSCTCAFLDPRYARNWRYHKDRRVWLTRDSTAELLEKTDTHERGWYIVFDANAWDKVRKELTVRYDMLEERKAVATPSQP